MKGSIMMLGLVVLQACSASGDPTPPVQSEPEVPAPRATSIGGYVIDSTGVCIEKASVEVYRGLALLQRVDQLTPCTVWGYENGFDLKGLNPNQEVTIRASAPGWTPKDTILIPVQSWPAYEIKLSKTH